VLWVPPLGHSIDLHVRLTTPPWDACPALQFTGLGWSRDVAPPPGSAAATEEHLCQASASVWRLDAHLHEVFGREVLRHVTADCDMRALLSAQVAMRAVLSRVLPLPARSGRAASLLTIDAEDQLSYFINRRGRCSSVVGEPDDDLQFAKSCRTIMDRCEAHRVKAIFMVTGDEIHPSFRDAFGHPLIGLDDNRRVLDEMPVRGHDVACHGFDHEWWLSNGHSAIAPMTAIEKLRYFIETNGDVRILLGLARFVLSHAPELLRARRQARGHRSGRPFTTDEVRNDIVRWLECTGQSPRTLFIRYPGYVRSPATLEFLDQRFASTIDSSDLYDIELDLPAYPYALLSEAAGTLRRTRVIEVPCVWIDKLLRTRDMDSAGQQLERIARLARFPGSFMSFVTHTKVLGSTWGHCHVYLPNPWKGLAIPADRTSWERFANLLATQTDSYNRRDLESALCGASA
jgi:peptidoglycan/xylan/chitin deacetylase (PgdA/CDA1 family)